MALFERRYLNKKQSQKIAFFYGLGVMLIVTILIAAYYEFNKIPNIAKNTKQSVIQAINNERGKELKCYRVKNDILQGTQITSQDIEESKLFENSAPEKNISDKNEIIKKVVRIDLTKNTVIIPSMLINMDDVVSTDLRKQDYSHFKLNMNLKPEQYVDVRIKRKDGTDDIFLSKKKILEIDKNTIYIKINEMERSYVNNASVEAALINAELYTTIYIDPENQPKAGITYKLNEYISRLIDENPNIIKASVKSLEEKNKLNISKIEKDGNIKQKENSDAQNIKDSSIKQDNDKLEERKR